jgi:hypothetical protein
MVTSNMAPIPLDAMAAALVLGVTAGQRAKQFCGENRSSTDQLDSATIRSELAVALTLREWEALGIVNPEMGLPAAEQELERVLRGELRESGSLLTTMLGGVVWKWLSWEAILSLNAIIVVDPSADEELAVQLASWLWKHRKPGSRHCDTSSEIV